MAVVTKQKRKATAKTDSAIADLLKEHYDYKDAVGIINQDFRDATEIERDRVKEAQDAFKQALKDFRSIQSDENIARLVATAQVLDEARASKNLKMEEFAEEKQKRLCFNRLANYIYRDKLPAMLETSGRPIEPATQINAQLWVEMALARSQRKKA